MEELHFVFQAHRYPGSPSTLGRVPELSAVCTLRILANISAANCAVRGRGRGKGHPKEHRKLSLLKNLGPELLSCHKMLLLFQVQMTATSLCVRVLLFSMYHCIFSCLPFHRILSPFRYTRWIYSGFFSKADPCYQTHKETPKRGNGDTLLKYLC